MKLPTTVASSPSIGNQRGLAWHNARSSWRQTTIQRYASTLPAATPVDGITTCRSRWEKYLCGRFGRWRAKSRTSREEFALRRRNFFAPWPLTIEEASSKQGGVPSGEIKVWNGCPNGAFGVEKATRD